uniref:Uncharacterized protein n=1 Tax=viral metagenome TaxID=1070528 RepID=A0A6M3LJ31_9ZZZZ
MTDEELLARRLFKEQIRKELLDEIKGYKIGYVLDGAIYTYRGGKLEGYILAIPEEKYNELFGGKNGHRDKPL